MQEPAAYLHDVINDPAGADMEAARAAIWRLAAKIADPTRSSEMQKCLVAVFQALADATNTDMVDDGAAQFDIGGKQIMARALLGQAVAAGAQ